VERIPKKSVSGGPGGVRLVISDAHEGLTKAINKPLLGVSRQRCTVHSTRNVLSHVNRAIWQMVQAFAARIWTAVARPDQ